MNRTQKAKSPAVVGYQVVVTATGERIVIDARRETSESELLAELAEEMDLKVSDLRIARLL